MAPARPAAAVGPFRVVDVVDGDTIWVEERDGRVKVRLLGIDTPETRDPDRPLECFGPEATAAITEAAAGGQVWLEVDPSQDTRDRYGRLLAYVWLDETTLLNRDLIAGGFAREYTYDQPYRYQPEFRSVQTVAQDAGAGLWSACAG